MFEFLDYWALMFEKFLRWLLVTLLDFALHVLDWANGVLKWLNSAFSTVLIRLRKEEIQDALSNIVPASAIKNAKVILLETIVNNTTNKVSTEAMHKKHARVILAEEGMSPQVQSLFADDAQAIKLQ